MTVIVGTMLTFTGRRVKPLDLRPDDIDPLDIAHSLACIARYNGMAKHFLSVGEHSVRCARRFSRDDSNRKVALLHDATETYLGDLIAPLKLLDDFEFFREAEDRAWRAIAERFDLPEEMPEEIHTVDIEMRVTEMRDLLPAYKPQKGDPAPYPFKIVPWLPSAAKSEMIQEMRDCGIKVKIRR